MPSTWAANPYTIPDWSAAPVDLPISSLGSAMSTLVRRAAREVRASIEISIPGPMIPPRYSPERRDHVVVDRGPEVHDHAGVAAEVIAGDRVHQAVGPELVRVLEQDRHPGLGAGADDQRLALQIALEHVAVLGHQPRHHGGHRLAVDLVETDVRAGRAGCEA